MNLLRRNAVANFLGRAFTALLWVAVTPFVLSRLGPERFGIWSLFFTFLSYLLAFDLGLSSTMTRFVAAKRGSGDGAGLRRTLRKGLGLGLGLGLVWAIFVVVTRGWVVGIFRVPSPIVPETLEALILFALAVLLMFPAQVILGSLQGFERLDLSNLCMAIGVASQVVTLYVGLAAGAGLKAAAVAGVVSQGVTGLLGAGMLRGRLREIPHGEKETGPSWRDLMHFGAALQLAGLLVVVQLQSGKITLGLLGNLAMVSDYEVAFRVANAVGSLPVLIMLSVIPAASHAWERGGGAAVVPLFMSTSRWVYSLAVMTLGMLWLVAPDITRVWLGPEHDRIAFLIRLWVIVYATILVWGPGTAVARGIGIPWLEVWGLTASVIANVGLSLWWVPRYGTAGAIAALGASFGVAVVLFVATFHGSSGMPFRPWLSRAFLPRALVGLSAVALCTWLTAAGPVAEHLPPLGWGHAAAVAVLFLGVFSLVFAPLGDPQRLWHMAWQAMAGVLARRREPAAP